MRAVGAGAARRVGRLGADIDLLGPIAALGVTAASLRLVVTHSQSVSCQNA